MRRKKAVINIISSLILQICSIIVGFIIPRLIIGSYGSNVNGLVVSITQFLSFITLLEAGFGPVIKSLLYKPISQKNKDEIERILKASERIFRKIAYIFLAYIIVLCAFFPMIITKEFDKIYTVSLLVIISISTFAEYYFGMTYKLYLQAEQKTYVINIIQISAHIINTIVVFVLIKLNLSIQAVKLVSSIIFILRPVLQNIYVKKKYNLELKEINENVNLVQKWDGLAHHIAYVVHKNVDVIILTLCGSLKEISVYSVYLLIINGIKNISESITGGIDAAFGNMIARGEEENLNKNFKVYEGLYFTVITIIFSCTLCLIIPFVNIYTRGFTDADYIRPKFAYIMIIAEFICMIRLPYNDLIKVSGHFKQTMVGAYIEAILNILISFILVWHFGIIGVAIGTLVAMTVRAIEFMYHTSKYILKRSIFYTFKRPVIISIEVCMICFIIKMIPSLSITDYKTWFTQAILVFAISAIVVISINLLIYKEDLKKIFNKIEVSKK